MEWLLIDNTYTKMDNIKSVTYGVAANRVYADGSISEYWSIVTKDESFEMINLSACIIITLGTIQEGENGSYSEFIKLYGKDAYNFLDLVGIDKNPLLHYTEYMTEVMRENGRIK